MEEPFDGELVRAAAGLADGLAVFAGSGGPATLRVGVVAADAGATASTAEEAAANAANTDTDERDQRVDAGADDRRDERRDNGEAFRGVPLDAGSTGGARRDVPVSPTVGRTPRQRCEPIARPGGADPVGRESGPSARE